MSKTLDKDQLRRFVDAAWDQSIVPELCNYVRIPNKSPLFDPQWEEHGHMEKAVQLLTNWCRRQPTRAHAPDIRRNTGDRRHGAPHRRRAALRPSRQAARIHRLA
jgi:hypothetical protein